MATRSFIITPTGDSLFRGVYCHWDGYPEGVGATLAEHYTDDEKIDRLVKLGSLSSLGSLVEPAAGQTHTFDSPAEDTTVAYHRDRGEDMNLAEGCTLTEILALAKESWCEYAYIRDTAASGGWRVVDLFAEAEEATEAPVVTPALALVAPEPV
jgi:hypothetical protein